LPVPIGSALACLNNDPLAEKGTFAKQAKAKIMHNETRFHGLHSAPETVFFAWKELFRKTLPHFHFAARPFSAAFRLKIFSKGNGGVFPAYILSK